jgi:DNA invertase Pin-like site-specific DNA recombinase
LNYSYKRISDETQQEINLETYSIDKRYIDKDADRPELQRLLETVKEGDHVYVESISMLGRNVDGLRDLTEQFKAKGAVVHFVKEGFDTSGHMYKFMLVILRAISEMERDAVREGMGKAKRYGTKSGRPIGRPEPELPATFEEIYNKVKSGKYTKVEAAKYLGVSRVTVYRWIKYYEEGRG